MKRKEKGKKAGTGRFKAVLIDFLCDLTGSIFFAMGIYTFARMANFAPGGISGLALIANHLWNLPIGVVTILLNIPLVIISWRVVGKEFLLRTARTMIMTTVFLDVVFPLIPPYSGMPLLASLYSGVCTGVGMAFFYLRGSSSGGTDFLIMTIKVRHPYMSFGFVTMTLDFLVIMLGWPVFGNVDAVLYGLICSFTTSIVMDKILYGMGAGKLVIVITNRSSELVERISRMTGRGSTMIRAIGTYTGEDRDVLLCACSKAQTYSITNAAHDVDEKAFVMVTETSEVFGEGFIERRK